MGTHPVNLAFRFLLELAAIAALVVWGARTIDGAWGWAVGIGAAVVGMVVWGTFRVPGDESASGEAPVAVAGPVRLGIELALFGLATWGLVAVGLTTAAWILGAAVVVHYALSWDRIGWLVGAS
ncbi:MAG: YrdB family protein [Acidimicrobiia bacterium]